jgi:hypothetical protein
LAGSLASHNRHDLFMLSSPVQAEYPRGGAWRHLIWNYDGELSYALSRALTQPMN